MMKLFGWLIAGCTLALPLVHPLRTGSAATRHRPAVGRPGERSARARRCWRGPARIAIPSGRNGRHTVICQWCRGRVEKRRRRGAPAYGPLALGPVFHGATARPAGAHRTEVRNRQMPLPRYVLLHPEARLSERKSRRSTIGPKPSGAPCEISGNKPGPR